MATRPVQGGSNDTWGTELNAWLDTFVPDVVAAKATGVAATDTAVLQAAIDATPVGGWLMISGGYKINAALSITKHITTTGQSFADYGASVTSGEVGGVLPVSPYFAGTTITQTVAATDAIQITGSGVSVNLKRFGIIFQAGLASTGHGINASPSQMYGTGHDIGLWNFVWEQFGVYGHDGNHYAYYMLNPLLGTITHARSYGGGGFYVASDTGSVNPGNLVFNHPYACLFNTGSAAGFAHSCATVSSPGNLNLLVYVRPQAILSGASQTAGTQYGWNDKLGAADPTAVNVIAPDMETNGNVSFGSQTQIIGIPFVSSNSRYQTGLGVGTGAAMAADKTVGDVAAFGYQAAKALTTGGQTTALGWNALADVTTGARNSALGAGAAQHNTGSDNTAVGATALQGTAGSSTGGSNTAVGSQALTALTTGASNVAIGYQALLSATTGANNTVIGYAAGYFTNGSALNAIVGGGNNTFVGYESGSYSGNITQAVAVGSTALAGTNGVAVGYQAQSRTNNATAIGPQTVASQNPSLALGLNASATGAGSVAIGTDSAGAGVATAIANQIALGTANQHILLKTVAAPADASFAASQFSLWLDPTAGAAKLMVKAKNASGVVVTGSVTLA